MIEAFEIGKCLTARLEANRVIQILECGCADGRFYDLLEYCCRIGAEVQPNFVAFGVDSDATKIERATKRNTSLKLIHADLSQTNFDDSSFDVVIANSTLEHFQRLDPAVREISRITKPNGLVIITIPSVDFESALMGVKLRRFLGRHEAAQAWAREKSEKITHLHYETPEWWTKLFHEHGFRKFFVQEIVSPSVVTIGDGLQWIRDSGIGGSRFSLADPKNAGIGFRILRMICLTSQFLLTRIIRNFPNDKADHTACGAYLIGMYRCRDN